MGFYSKRDLTRLLERIEEAGMFPGYKFCKINDEFLVLGSGMHSIVCKIICEKDNKCYALKIMFINHKKESINEYTEAIYLQRRLGKESPYILKVLDERIIWICFNRNELLDGIFGNIEVYLVLLEELINLSPNSYYTNNNLLLNEKEVLRFGIQICEALSILHNEHFLHRDVKLENIYFDKQNNVFKLGDFGCTVNEYDHSRNVAIYTNGYCPPEIKNMTDNYSVTSEIYSLGICLYLLLNDYKFPASDNYQVNKVQYSSYFTFPAPINASAQLARLIRKMCSYSKKNRHQSLNEVQSELIKLLQEIKNGEKKNDELKSVYFG